MSRVQVFDVDHTLVRRSTGQRFAGCGYREGLFSLGQILNLPLLYIAYRMGFFTIADLTAKLATFAGTSEAKMREVAGNCFAERIRSDVYPDAARRIEDGKKDGDIVVLATTSIDFLVQPLAEYLEADEVIASRLEFQDGVSTGRTLGQACFGKEKRDRVLAYLSAKRIPTEKVSFYTDSHHDLPLLEAVGDPVAVNPDRKLRAIARSRGWKIESF
jgi:HAD superfamily hydrolase (TIGR01490 family)